MSCSYCIYYSSEKLTNTIVLIGIPEGKKVTLVPTIYRVD